MNKINLNIRLYALLLTLLSISGLFSCSKNSLEAIPVEISFEKPEVRLANFVQEMETADNGWEFGLSTRNVGYFAGYLDFSATEAQFTIDIFAGETPSLRQSSYRTFVEKSNPSLAFNSGAFLDFAARAGNIDTVYTFQSMRQDTIFLLGNRYGNQLKLVRATSAKAEAFANGAVSDVINTVNNLAKLRRYFKRLVVNGAEYDLHFRPDLKTLFIHYGGTQRFKIHETAYAPTATGISLEKPLVDGINILAYFDGLAVDLQRQTLSIMTEGLSRVFTNEYAPSAYDLTAAQRFYSTPPYSVNINYPDGTISERYSASAKGFTVAGVEDAFGLNSIPQFNFFMFLHKFSQQEYGAGWFVIDNNLENFGPAVLRQIADAAGVIRFVRIGDFASPPVSIASIIQNTSNTFTDEQGFFVIRAGGINYDLVSINVTAGQKWIRFE